MPTPLSSREPGQSIALAARKIKVYSNDRALLKMSILVSQALRMSIDFFSLLANLKIFVMRYNGESAYLKIAQSPAFAVSFLARISTSLTPTFFPLLTFFCSWASHACSEVIENRRGVHFPK
jgi:hypothetical protein